VYHPDDSFQHGVKFLNYVFAKSAFHTREVKRSEKFEGILRHCPGRDEEGALIKPGREKTFDLRVNSNTRDHAVSDITVIRLS